MHSRAYGIASDASWAELLGSNLGQADDSVLRGHISGILGESYQASNTGSVDDGASVIDMGDLGPEVLCQHVQSLFSER